MPRARCPLCRKPASLPNAIEREFYRTTSTIGHLQGRPQLIPWILEEEAPRVRRALLRQWASVCSNCRDEFVRTRSSVLIDCLDALVKTIRDKARSLEHALSGARLQCGAAEGVREYVIRIRDDEKERLGSGLTESGFVYAVSAGKHVKIGWAKDLDKRVATLQTSSPRTMRLLGSVIAFRRDERQIQQRFYRYHVRGEWYRDVPAIRRFFAALPRDHPRNRTDVSPLVYPHV